MLARVGRYRLVREVGRGAAGQVYEARTPDGQRVALKRLLAGSAASPLQRRRMATEVQTLLRIRHPHVVGLLDAGEEEGVPYLVLEWVEGESLQARLDRAGPLAPDEAAALALALATALAHCHAQGVLHRDLEPENVLLRAGAGGAPPTPLLTDFGLARDLIDQAQASLAGRSIQGRCLGSPGYWPPEQAMGEVQRVGPPSDVYGLGGLLYAALCGLPPNRGETLLENLSALNEDPEPPGRLRPGGGVPPGLEAVCLRCLARAPEDRYPDAGAVVSALRACLAAPPAARTATRSAAPEPAPAGRARGRWPLFASLTILALGLGGVLRTLALRWRARAAHVEASPPPEVAPPRPGDPPLEPPTGPLVERPLVTLDPPLPAEQEPPHERPAPATPPQPAPEPETAPGPSAQPAPDPAAERAAAEAAQLHARGNARRLARDYPGAREDLERSLALDPRVACAWNDLGDARSKLGDQQGALQAFDRAIELEPGFALARLCRGALRLRLQDHPGALEDLDVAIAAEPGPVALNYRAAARRALGDLTGGLADLDRALALSPHPSPELHYARAVFRSEAGQAAGARDDLTRFLELAPPNHPQRDAAKRLLEQLGAR